MKLEKLKSISEETKAEISILVSMIWDYTKNKTYLITIVTIQSSISTFNAIIKATGTWIVTHIFIRYYAIHKR